MLNLPWRRVCLATELLLISARMQTHPATMYPRPSVALADYDFLRSTYEMLLRAPVPNHAAINAAFQALEAAHERLRVAHEHWCEGHIHGAIH